MYDVTEVHDAGNCEAARTDGDELRMSVSIAMVENIEKFEKM